MGGFSLSLLLLSIILLSEICRLIGRGRLRVLRLGECANVMRRRDGCGDTSGVLIISSPTKRWSSSADDEQFELSSAIFRNVTGDSRLVIISVGVAISIVVLLRPRCLIAAIISSSLTSFSCSLNLVGLCVGDGGVVAILEWFLRKARYRLSNTVLTLSYDSRTDNSKKNPKSLAWKKKERKGKRRVTTMTEDIYLSACMLLLWKFSHSNRKRV